MKTSEVYYILARKRNNVRGKRTKTNYNKMKQSSFHQMSEQCLRKHIGETDLIVLCIVDPAWKQEDEVFRIEYVFNIL